ncbi:MAG: hypothetical protein IJQ69_06265, partial [Bacteroidales bacterium]|nr:hypothetical protein [Bacteroidales bacterium]
AQPKEGCECVFAPKAGQVQFQLNVGTGQFFNDMTGLYYMLPDEDGTAMGIGSDKNTLEPGTFGNAYISGDLSTLLTNSGSMNFMTRNYTVGMKVFVSDHININLSGAYMLNMQPKKDFIEGESYQIDDLNIKDYDVSITDATVGVGDIYASKAILGAVTNKLMVQLGTEYYFNTRNERIFPYIGVFGQFKMARIESLYPYTGQYIPTDYPAGEGYPDMANEEVDMYRASRGGQALGFGGGINIGVEYALMEGLFVGVEVAPVCYQYTLLHLQVGGQDPYYATNHNLRAFAFPQLTLGFRF